MRELNVYRKVSRAHPFIKLCYGRMCSKYKFLSFKDYEEKELVFSMKKTKIKITLRSSKSVDIKFETRGYCGTINHLYITVVNVADKVACLAINNETRSYGESENSCICSVNEDLASNMMNWKKKNYLLAKKAWTLHDIEEHVPAIADVIHKVKASLDKYKKDFFDYGLK